METRLSPKTFSQKMEVHVPWRPERGFCQVGLDFTLTELEVFFQGQHFTNRKEGRKGNKRVIRVVIQTSYFKSLHCQVIVTN